MKPIHKKLHAALLITMLLGGCATAIPINGQTKAGTTLKSDTANMVIMRAKIYAKCDQVDSINTQIVKVHPVGVTGLSAAAKKYGRTDELWTVSLCGQQVPVSVTFTPDGEGGTFFSTSINTKEK